MTISRESLLERWATAISVAARDGKLSKKPISIKTVSCISGPRAGALRINAGLDSGLLLKSMTIDDGALMRQFIPYEFSGDPSTYMAGRYVRMEAGWPDDLSDRNIIIDTAIINPHGATPVGAKPRWVVGKNENGSMITCGLNDKTPHWLVAGQTGSGKTVALQSLITQLSRDPANRLILADGKFGSGFRCFDRLPGLIGPVAVDVDTTRSALSWAVGEMTARYQSGVSSNRIIIVLDEIQEFSQDNQLVEMLRRLIAQGRGVDMYCMLGTQYPLASIFGDNTIKRNLVGRLALRTTDYIASQVIVGNSTPRADRLLGQGDAYAITPEAIHRVQVGYVTRREIDSIARIDPTLTEWPDADCQDNGLPEYAGQFSGTEVAVSIITASMGKGRTFLGRAMAEAGLQKPGGDRGTRLLKIGREAVSFLEAQGISLCAETGESVRLSDAVRYTDKGIVLA